MYKLLILLGNASNPAADCLREGETETERDIHYVNSASLAHEDGIVFISEPSAARQ